MRGGALDALIAARRPAVIINATAFSARRGDDTTVLDAADCPVLQVALAGAQPATHGRASSRGLAPSDLAMNVVLPELDGRLFTRAISFKSEREADDDLEYAGVLHEPAADRVAFVAELAAAWARLGANAPRGAAARAHALRLSRARRPHRLCRAGSTRRRASREILELLARCGICDRASNDAGWRDHRARSPMRTPREALERAHRTLSRAGSPRCRTTAADAIDGAWGAPEDDPACVDGRFRFPCLTAGNVIVVLQPDRGSRADRKQGYHDTVCPPRHGYVALYALLRAGGAHRRAGAPRHARHARMAARQGAGAVARPALPKRCSARCRSSIPFIVNNPGEAVQAKRRISAVTIGHLTPPLSDAGLHGPLGRARRTDRGILPRPTASTAAGGPLLEAEILERAWRSGLAEDCGVERG